MTTPAAGPRVPKHILRTLVPGFLTPGVAYMLLSTVAYLGVNTCVKELKGWPTHQLLFFRSAVSLVLTFGYIWWAGIRPVFGHRPDRLAFRGIAGICALYCYFYTLQRIPMASAVTIQYLSPIFTAIIAMLILKEYMKPVRWLYFLISFIGVLLVKGIDIRVSGFDLSIGLLGALASGFAYTAVRMAGKNEHAMIIVLYFPLMATPTMGALCLTDWVWPTPREWFIGLAMGVFTQFGQVFATTAIQNEPLNKVTYINYIGVLYALGIGFLFYGEGYDLISLAGMLLVILGVVMNVIDQDKRRRLKVKVMRRKAARYPLGK